MRTRLWPKVNRKAGKRNEIQAKSNLQAMALARLRVVGVKLHDWLFMRDKCHPVLDLKQGQPCLMPLVLSHARSPTAEVEPETAIIVSSIYTQMHVLS